MMYSIPNIFLLSCHHCHPTVRLLLIVVCLVKKNVGLSCLIRYRAGGKVGVFESSNKITTTIAETTAMNITDAVKSANGKKLSNVL